MDINELHQRLEQVDDELADKQIPVVDRPNEAFKIIESLDNSKSIFTPGMELFIDTNLFGVITGWYCNLYGVNKVASSNFEIGQNPVLIRGEVYYIGHYASYGSCFMNMAQILSRVEDLTEALVKSLDELELQVIADKFLLGHDAFTAILPLEDDQHISFSELSKNLLNRGIANVHSSVAVLKYTRDPQSVAFPVQQSVEMFLKAFLARLEPNLNENDLRREFSHGIDRALEALIRRNEAFQEIRPLVAQVSMNMNDRYRPVDYTFEKAVNVISDMLKVFKFTGDQWFAQPQQTS